jgi:hypothetical protein
VNLLIPGEAQLLESQADDSPDMPSQMELVTSVRDFLRDDAMANLTGRSQFLARVASNSLDIVLRELTVGGRHQRAEQQRLQAYFESDASLMSLRRRLSQGLRAGEIGLDDIAVQQHLRQTVVNQIAIDQPKYSGLRRAKQWG